MDHKCSIYCTRYALRGGHHQGRHKQASAARCTWTYELRQSACSFAQALHLETPASAAAFQEVLCVAQLPAADLQAACPGFPPLINLHACTMSWKGHDVCCQVMVPTASLDLTDRRFTSGQRQGITSRERCWGWAGEHACRMLGGCQPMARYAILSVARRGPCSPAALRAATVSLLSTQSSGVRRAGSG